MFFSRKFSYASCYVASNLLYVDMEGRLGSLACARGRQSSGFRATVTSSMVLERRGGAALAELCAERERGREGRKHVRVML